ncbi:metalloregulator ArsR/SmtB family transcription factor [Nocardia neocaledoniensis]|uniref:ArsR family transcriptional regulator n=1 Tax=Nocardia neocaledoniensis TaxID=236511 RepID=A0A317N9R4_9NOCA|nr:MULTISPECIES: metalloregulator ArsR/SmtB family transcription factor [Nocardia]PWV70348.1 ArsR family transcriptional regulator [Nocardia neocaledoniensis]UGT56063.1 metalloregulator ArsR/SmtB family transcription factor [Nocardia asteroides]
MDTNGVRAITALSDPTRRAIFEALPQGPRAVAELAAATGITSSAASQHLRVLREAHLVSMRRDGNRHLYSLDPRGLADARDYLDQFRPSALAAHAARLRDAAGPDPAQPTRR